MKILIISATTGEGHNSFAKAVKEYYAQNHSEIDVKYIDLYKPYHKFTAYFVNEFSFFFLRNFPQFSINNYRKQCKNPVNKDKNNSLKFGKIAKKTILKQINEYKPDIIFTTQTYATGLINWYKRNNIINIPHYSIVPDFVIHFDVENHIDSDLIFVSNKYVYDLLVSRGFDPSKLVISGLPVHPMFKNVAVTKKDMPVITVSFGGNGLHHNYKVVKKLWPLLEDNYIFVLNGHDKSSYNKINKLKHPHLINLAFTDKIPEILNMSDVVIGKIGGATTSECLQLKVPLIVPFKSYCQEEYSLKLLQVFNLVFKSNIDNLKDDVLQILNTKPDFKDIDKIHNFNSTQIICETMLNEYNRKETK